MATTVLDYRILNTPYKQYKETFGKKKELLERVGARITYNSKKNLFLGQYQEGDLTLYISNRIDPSLRPDTIILENKTFLEALWTFTTPLTKETYREKQQSLQELVQKVVAHGRSA